MIDRRQIISFINKRLGIYGYTYTERECVKVTFETKEAAAKRLAEILVIAKEQEKKPISYYQCRDCGFYHLTSMSKKKQRTVVYRGSVYHRAAKLARAWIQKKGWKDE